MGTCRGAASPSVVALQARQQSPLVLPDTIRAAIKVATIVRPVGPAKIAVALHGRDGSSVLVDSVLTADSDTAENRILLTLDAFGALYERAAAAQRRVLLYIADSVVRRELARASESFPLAHFAVGLCGAAGSVLAEAHHAASESLSRVQEAELAARTGAVDHELGHRAPMAQQALTLYTDGSVRLGFRGCGMAVVSSTGHIHARWAPHQAGVPVLAELLAIEMAVTRYRHAQLTIRTDSQTSIELIRGTTPRLAVQPGSVRDAVRRILDASAGRTVRLEWVRGHSGDAMNEFADRAARTVRRGKSMGVEPSAVEALLENITSELKVHIAEPSASVKFRLHDSR